MRRILVLQPASGVAASWSSDLRQQGFEVLSAVDVAEALRLIAADRIDVVLCPNDLGGQDGTDFCQRVRQSSDVPVIVVGEQETPVIVAALEGGADKYLSPDTPPREMAARITSLLRRVDSSATSRRAIVNVRDVQIDRDGLVVRREGTRLSLTATELAVVMVLAEQPGAIVPRERLIEEVWGYASRGDHALRTTIKRVRKKIEADPSNPEVIKTARGIGYFLGRD